MNGNLCDMCDETVMLEGVKLGGARFLFRSEPVPYWGEGRQAQDWAKAPWSIWVKDSPGPSIFLHRCQQEQRYHGGRRLH